MRKKLSILLSFILVLQFLAYIPHETVEAASKRTAQIKEVSGTVTVVKAGGSKKFTAYRNMNLNEGDHITTGKNSSVILQVLDQKDEITIGANAKLYISELRGETGKKTKLKLWSGNTYMKVSPLRNSEDEIEVETPTATMGVRGTHFLVGVDPHTGETTLVVASGIVRSTQVERGDRDPSMSHPPSLSLYPAQQLQLLPNVPMGPEVTFLDLDHFIQMAEPPIIQALIRSHDSIRMENEQLINQINSGQMGSPTPSLQLETPEDLSRYATNLNNFVSIVVNNAVSSGVVTQDEVNEYVQRVNEEQNTNIQFAPVNNFDLTPEQLEAIERARQVEEQLRQQQQQLEEQRRQLQQENQQLLDRINQQREMQEQQNLEQQREEQSQAVDRFLQLLSPEEQERFKAARQELLGGPESPPSPPSPPAWPTPPPDPGHQPGNPVEQTFEFTVENGKAVLKFSNEVEKSYSSRLQLPTLMWNGIEHYIRMWHFQNGEMVEPPIEVKDFTLVTGKEISFEPDKPLFLGPTQFQISIHTSENVEVYRSEFFTLNGSGHITGYKGASMIIPMGDLLTEPNGPEVVGFFIESNSESALLFNPYGFDGLSPEVYLLFLEEGETKIHIMAIYDDDNERSEEFTVKTVKSPESIEPYPTLKFSDEELEISAKQLPGFLDNDDYEFNVFSTEEIVDIEIKERSIEVTPKYFGTTYILIHGKNNDLEITDVLTFVKVIVGTPIESDIEVTNGVEEASLNPIISLKFSKEVYHKNESPILNSDLREMISFYDSSDPDKKVSFEAIGVDENGSPSGWITEIIITPASQLEESSNYSIELNTENLVYSPWTTFEEDKLHYKFKTGTTVTTDLQPVNITPANGEVDVSIADTIIIEFSQEVVGDEQVKEGILLVYESQGWFDRVVIEDVSINEKKVQLTYGDLQSNQKYFLYIPKGTFQFTNGGTNEAIFLTFTTRGAESN